MKVKVPDVCPRARVVEHLGAPDIHELTRLDPSFNRVYRCGECSHVWSPSLEPVTAMVAPVSAIAGVG